MTTFERYEREIPRLMDELAPPRLPDYVDDLLSRTARTSQRPAWASLERWLPMVSTTRAMPFRPASAYGIVLIVLLLLAMILAVFVAGSRLQSSDPLSSLVMASDSAGIVAIDPATGESTAMVDGIDGSSPVIAPDGTRFAFMRGPEVVVADIDGSNSRTIASLSGGVDPVVAWSPDSAMIQATHEGSVALAPGSANIAVLTIIDVSSGTATDLDLGIDVQEGTIWRPGSSQLIVPAKTLAADGTEVFGLWLVNADGTGLRPIVDPVPNEAAWMSPTASPDGRLVAATVWDPEALAYPGRVVVIDIDAGTVAMPDTGGGDVKNEFIHQFSPDGSQLLIERLYQVAGVDASRLGLVPVSGGEARLIGPDMQGGEDGVETAFSPDGTQILAGYGHDRSTWLLDAVNGGEGTRLDWSISGPISWGTVQ